MHLALVIPLAASLGFSATEQKTAPSTPTDIVAPAVNSLPPVAVKQKSKSLKEIIDLVLETGRSRDFEMLERMGLNKNLLVKSLRYKRSVTPDGKEHTIAVVYEESEGQRKPVALIITAISAVKQDAKLVTDGLWFRATLDGALERIFRNSGAKGDVETKELPANKESRAQLKSEIDFFTKKAPLSGIELQH